MSSLRSSEGDEAERLAVLESYAILDTAPEVTFDDIVALAKLICTAPIGVIGFAAADRQWFKARSGLDVDVTPLESSLCVHALVDGAMLVIPDLTQDARTNQNKLVIGTPAARFYAGVPLRAPEGYLIGALSVLDIQPRSAGLTQAQGDGMRALARQTMVLMELRRSAGHQEEALRRERQSSRVNLNRALASEMTSGWLREARMRAIAAQEVGGIGTFETDLAANVTWVSGVFCRTYGLPEAELYPTHVLEDLVIAEDRPSLASLDAPDNVAAKPVIDFRIRRADDQALRWVTRRAEYVRDEAGEPVCLIGTALDITERKLIDLRQRALLELEDAARGAATLSEVMATASRSLGESLQVARVGCAVVDTLSGSLRIDSDWVAPGVASLVGHYPTSVFQQTLARAAIGGTVVVENVKDTDWLGNDRAHYAAIATGAMINAPMFARDGLVGLLFLHNASVRTWGPDEAAFAQAVADRTYAHIAKIKAEEDQRLLNQELSHRLKNTLAMVQAIATQSLKAVAERNVVDAFNQRLLALGTAHDILLQNSWAAARIRAVVDGVLSLHTDLLRFQVRGADLNLGAKAVLSLSMLLHELATNAVKYGALSSDAGNIILAWAVDYAVEPAIFIMTWREVGGPAIANPPSRQGFGSRLMRVGLAGTGNSTLRYEPGGLIAEFRAPLPMLTVD